MNGPCLEPRIEPRVSQAMVSSTRAMTEIQGGKTRCHQTVGWMQNNRWKIPIKTHHEQPTTMSTNPQASGVARPVEDHRSCFHSLLGSVHSEEFDPPSSNPAACTTPTPTTPNPCADDAMFASVSVPADTALRRDRAQV